MKKKTRQELSPKTRDDEEGKKIKSLRVGSPSSNQDQKGKKKVQGVTMQQGSAESEKQVAVKCS